MAKKAKKNTKAVVSKRTNKAGRGNALSRGLIEKAFELYCEKMPIREISRKLSISPITIHKYKKAENWKQRRETRLQKAADKADDEYAKTRARHIKAAQALQTKGFDRIKSMNSSELTPSEARAYIIEGVRLERELLGRTTSDVQIKVTFPPELQDI